MVNISLYDIHIDMVKKLASTQNCEMEGCAKSSSSVIEKLGIHISNGFYEFDPLVGAACVILRGELI